jgi:hypothetical protein
VTFFFPVSVRTASHRLATRGVAVGAALLALAAAAPARAQNVVQNGNFSNTSAYYNYNGTTVGTNVNNSNLANWQINGCSGSSSTCGFQFIANSNLGSTGFYDAIDGHESTFYSTPGATPDGSNAFMSDGDYQVMALTQSLSGLKVGDTYTLSFYQASMQQTGYTGPSQDNWNVGLLNSNNVFDSRVAATMNNPSQGSTGWVKQTMTFVATTTSELLYFFASATAGAQPPFLLLDDVSMTDNASPSAVAEPATLTLAAAGLVGMIAARRRRRA